METDSRSNELNKMAFAGNPMSQKEIEMENNVKV